MRTMPSDTEVTVPSLRASAVSLTFSMRVLISSLISDGLSCVVAMGGSLEPALPPTCAKRNYLVRKRGLQATELALERAIDHHVAGVDHGAADQRGVDRGLDLDLATEALLQRGLDAFELAVTHRGGRGDARLDHAFRFGAQFLEQAGDFRQQREAAVDGQQVEEAAHRIAGTVDREQRDGVGVGQLRAADQACDLRVGGDARGKRQRVRPRCVGTGVARQCERGAGVGTCEGEGLAHRSQISAASSSSSALWALASISRRSSFSAPVTARFDTCLRRSSLARLAAATISASATAFWRLASAMASFLAWSMIWLARWWACSMISLALVRAVRSSPSAVSCACASARWLLSAAARPSAIFFWRSSSAAFSGGQMNFIVNQTRSTKESIWPKKVMLIFTTRPRRISSCRCDTCRTGLQDHARRRGGTAGWNQPYFTALRSGLAMPKNSATARPMMNAASIRPASRNMRPCSTGISSGWRAADSRNFEPMMAMPRHAPRAPR